MSRPSCCNAAVADLTDSGADVRGVECDVTSYESVERAANAAIDAFGKVHVGCNNAGVGSASGTDAISLQEWRWVIDVNLMGVVHGVRALLPHMKSHGQAAMWRIQRRWRDSYRRWVSARTPRPSTAVVGLSEALAVELAPHGIGVLCPGGVTTRIAESRRNWPTTHGPPPELRLGPQQQQIARTGRRGNMEPDEVANLVLQASRSNDLYVFTHPSMRSTVEDQLAGVLAAYPKPEPAPPESTS